MDPKRFLDGDDDAFETQLVRAARREGAPDGAMQRAAVALGVGAGSAALASGAGAAGLGASATGTAAKLGLFGVGKWFGVGILSGVVATSGFHFASALSSPAARPAIVSVEAARAPGPLPAPPAATPGEPDQPEPESVSPPEPASRPTEAAEPARSPARRTPAAVGGAAEGAAEPAPPRESEARVTSLSAELAFLHEARKALVARDPSRVLAELQKYSSSSRSGLLDTEAEVLRIEALVQAGRRPEAVALARSALDAAPGGPHASRFRRIIGDTPAP